MKNKDTKSEAAISRKEAMASSGRQHSIPNSEYSEEQIPQLIHELELTRKELDLLNKELGQTRILAEEAGKRFARLYNSSPFGILTISVDGFILDLNIRGANILNKEKNELLGQSLTGFISKSSLPIYHEFTTGIKRSKTETTCEIDLDVKDSSLKHLFLSGIWRDTDSQILIYMNDISALKNVEKKYINLVEKSGLAISTTDKQGRIEYFNKAFSKLFGYNSKEIRSKSQYDFIHPAYHELVRTIHQKKVNEKNTANPYEFKAIKKDGTEIWLEVNSTTLTENGLITGTRNYLWDISKRKHSENRFQVLFSKMKSGLAILNYNKSQGDFIVSEINDSGLSILQKSTDQMLNQPISKCLPGIKSSTLWNNFNKVLHTGKATWIPRFEYADDDMEVILEINIFMLLEGDISFEFEDITQKILAENDLKNSYSEIISLSNRSESIREEERKEIARNLHDDLGQLLTALKMDLSWMKKKAKNAHPNFEKRADSAIEIIHEAIGSVQKISSEMRPPVLDNLGLFEAIKSYMLEFTDRSKIKTSLLIPEEKIEFDPDLQITIFRIIQEALTNVARHSCASKVSLIIKKNMNILEIEIVDNGIGIPDKVIQSSDSLGLIGMFERVMRWQGHFWISGDKNQGTRIIINLPLNR